MDPIDKIKYVIAQWNSFIQEYRTFYYHGYIRSCPKDWLFLHVKSDYIKNIIPDIYAKYDNSLNWVYGWARVSFYKRFYPLLYRGDGSVSFRTRIQQENYDSMLIRCYLNKQNGAVKVSVSIINFIGGVENNNIPNYNYLMFYHSFFSPLHTIGLSWGKYGYYIRPYYIDWWKWKQVPSYWGYDYIINFKWYENLGKYQIWDNYSKSAYVSSGGFLEIRLEDRSELVRSYYPGVIYEYAGVKVLSVEFYKDVFT